MLNLHQESNETRKHRRDCGRSVGEFLVRAVKGFFSKKKRRPTWIREEDDEQGGSLLRHRHSSSTSTVKASKSEDRAYTQPQPPPSYREIFSRQTNINLVVYTFLALHSIACDQLLPIFMHNPPQTHRSANPDVHLPLKFAGGFGLDVGGHLSQPIASCPSLQPLTKPLQSPYSPRASAFSSPSTASPACSSNSSPSPPWPAATASSAA